MTHGAFVAAFTAAIALAAPGWVRADVRVVVGPTPIQYGDARSPHDITVINEKLAFALAVETAVPYGVPRGAIIDVAPVVDGKAGRDRVVFADFIPNNWSAWPNTRRQIEILERGPDRATVRTVRDWGKATVTTTYTLRRNADSIDIQTTLTNNGDAALSGLLSGLTLWPNSGFLFGVPGLSGKTEGPAEGSLSDRVVAYDESWAVTLHAPYVDHIGYGSKDMFLLHSLAPGESRKFNAQLQVGSRGDLAPILENEIRRKHLDSGIVSGVARSKDGTLLATPILVIEKRGHLFAWTIGRAGAFEVRLPVGEYSLYATAKNYSRSQPAAVTVTADSRQTRDFGDLEYPGHIHFSVRNRQNNRPMDARISIKEGQKPPIGFLGHTTFFTELDRIGSADFAIAPGRYLFTVSSGGGFTSPRRDAAADVKPGRTTQTNVALKVSFDPAARGWYSADMHHHADQAEAVTPAADLARSQLAAGLDLLFVSDHDSTANIPKLQRFAARRGVPFVAGIELSPSWGHFNAYPLSAGSNLAIDTGSADVNALFAEARRLGAIAIQANHPFIPFGYMNSAAAGLAPGGFNPAFDLLEINAAETGDEQVMSALKVFWNSGHRYYLTAGTDTHDVWKEESGRVRVFAHIEGPVSARAFAQALKDGHAYVSYGPLIFPSAMFGETLRLRQEEPFNLAFDLKSIAGLARAELACSGGVAGAETFDGTQHEARVAFALKANQSTWYSLEVTDRLGKKAYTDPIWVDVVRL